MTLLSTLLSTAWGASVSGAVVGGDGSLIEGATVYAINNRFQAAQTTTDALGQYGFTSLPEGWYRIYAIPKDDDNYAARHHPSSRSFCDAAQVEALNNLRDINVSLPVGLTVTGRVVEQDGTPISGVRIKADSPDLGVTRHTDSTTDGTFTVLGLERDTTWNLQASKVGFPIQWFGDTYDANSATPIDPNQNQPVGTWHLLDGIGLSGAVTGPDGPVPNAAVRLYSSSQLVQTLTDENGEYSATGLPPGDVIAWAAAPGLATTYFPSNDRPTESISATEEGDWIADLDLQLPLEATIQVQLVGDAPRTDGDLSDIPLVLYNDNQSIGRSAQTDTDGLAQFSGLHGGTYTVLAYASDVGHPDDWIRDSNGHVLTIDVESETENGPVELSLAKAITIEGSIKDDHGVPIPGASILFQDPIGSDTRPHTIATSDAQGLFQAVGLPAGTWMITAQSNPICPTDSGHVTTYWPNEVDPFMAQHFQTTTTQSFGSLHLVLPRDADQDAMSDRWENRYGLNINRNDAAEDPDKDGFNNLTEYRMRSNPLTPEGEWVIENTCGCSSTTIRPAVEWWSSTIRPAVVWLVTLLSLFSRRAEASLHKSAPGA